MKEDVKFPLENGQWFTYVIYMHFCAYSIIMMAFLHFKVPDKKSPLILFVLIISFTLLTRPIADLLNNTGRIDNNLSIYSFFTDLIYPFFRFLPYFLLGAFIKCHFDRILMTLNPYILIISFILAYYMVYISSHIIILLIGKLLMTVTIFMIFSYCSRYISYNGILKRHFVWLGKSTLQIYLLHYFFIAFLCYVIPTEFAEILSHNHYIYFISVLMLALGCTYGCMGVVYLLKKIGLYSYIFPRRNLYRDMMAKRMSRSSAI